MKRIILLSLLLLALVTCSEPADEDDGTLDVPTAVSNPTQPASNESPTNTPVADEIDNPVEPTEEVGESGETAVPTPTLALTPTAEPTIAPIAIETSSELPALSRSVLVLADNRFKRWDVQRNSIEELMAANGEFALTAFSASANGEWAVVSERIREADPAIYHLYRVNTISGEVTLWLSGVPELRYLQVSPDGTQLLYVIGQPPAEDEEANHFGDSDVRVVPLLQDEPAREVGVCRAQPDGNAVGEGFWLGNCTGITWTPDSQNMLWADVEGVWMRHKDASEPRLLLGTDADASSGAVSSLYEPVSWARNGRYLLMQQIYFEAINWVVLDVATGQVSLVPESGFGVGTGFVDVQWMQDDRLLILQEQPSPTLRLVRVQEDLSMTIEETAQPEFPPEALLAGGVHLENGRFALLIGSSNPETRGVYVMASSNEPAVKVNEFPFLGPYQTEPVWLMDGSGLFLLPNQSTASVPYYIANNESAPVYNLATHLGQSVQQLMVVKP